MTELERACTWDTMCGNTPEKRELWSKLPRLYMDLISEEYEELLIAYADNDLVETLDALGDLLKVVSGMVHSLGYCPEKLLKVINDSNFSKFTQDEMVAQISVDAYNGQDRYHDVTYTQHGDHYIIKGYEGSQNMDNSAGKVLKQIYYVQPNLQEFVDGGLDGHQ